MRDSQYITLNRLQADHWARVDYNSMLIWLFPDGTMPFPEPMLTNNQWCLLVSTSTEGNFSVDASASYPWCELTIAILMLKPHLSGTIDPKHVYCGVDTKRFSIQCTNQRRRMEFRASEIPNNRLFFQYLVQANTEGHESPTLLTNKSYE